MGVAKALVQWEVARDKGGLLVVFLVRQVLSEVQGILPT